MGTKASDMGDGLPYVIESKKMRMITVGGYHACALLEDDTVKCWGRNEFGQLGIETTEPHGSAKGSMGTGLPPVALEPAGVKYTVQSISAGFNHTCALYKVGPEQKLKCWGQNSYAALGVGKMDLSIGGTPGSMGPNLPVVDLKMGTIADLQAYRVHTCARNSTGQIKCWGYNEDGILGIGRTDTRVGSRANDMGSNLPFVDLGLPVIKLSRGSMALHTCGILVNSYLKCWGRNNFGQLGYENNLNIGSSASDMGEALGYVRFE